MPEASSGAALDSLIAGEFDQLLDLNLILAERGASGCYISLYELRSMPPGTGLAKSGQTIKGRLGSTESGRTSTKTYDRLSKTLGLVIKDDHQMKFHGECKAVGKIKRMPVR
jgi:hypothetical protein